MTLGDVLGFYAKIQDWIGQAMAGVGQAIPVRWTIHTHGYTVLLQGTLTANKDGALPPPPTPAQQGGEMSSLGPESVPRG